MDLDEVQARDSLCDSSKGAACNTTGTGLRRDLIQLRNEIIRHSQRKSSSVNSSRANAPVRDALRALLLGCRVAGGCRLRLLSRRKASEFRFKMPQHLLQFPCVDQIDDVMADGRADDLCFQRGNLFQMILQQRARDCGKSVPVVKGERGKRMSLVTDLNDCSQGQPPFCCGFPKVLRCWHALGVVKRFQFLSLA